MLVSSFFFLKNNSKTKNIYSSCRASKWQFPLALTELPLVNTRGRVQFLSPVKHTFYEDSRRLEERSLNIHMSQVNVDRQYLQLQQQSLGEEGVGGFNIFYQPNQLCTT